MQIENSGVAIAGGALRTVGDGQWVIRQSFVTLSDAVFDNQGAVQVQTGTNGGATLVLDGTAISGGSVSVDAGSTLRTQGRSRVDGVNVLLTGMTNAGDLAIGAGGLTVADTYTQTGGTTVLEGGTLAAASVDLQAGVLAGNGTVAGNSVIAGTASAGLSTGIIDFAGDALFSGALIVELAGTAVDGAAPLANAINVATDPLLTAFDQYNVLGQAVLADGLFIDVDLLGTFAPSAGDFFDVITAGVLVADLDALAFDLPVLGGGTTLTASIVSFGNRQALRLSVAGVADVPAPASALLGAAGLVVIVVGRRRRRA